MKTKVEEVIALEDAEFARMEQDFYSKQARTNLLEQDALSHEEDCFMQGYETDVLTENTQILTEDTENEPNEEQLSEIISANERINPEI